MPSPADLTEQTYDAYVTGNPVVVVDFWAEWCKPCKAIEPMIHELAGKYDGKVWFARVDADQSPMKVRSLGVMGLPTLLVYKGGKVVEKIVGAVSKGALEGKITPHLA